MTARRRWGATRLNPGATRLRLGAALLAVAVVAAGCTAEPAPPPVAGGAAALPGPAPTGAGLRPAPADSPPAPSVSGTLTDGSALALADLWADRAVVLTFFTSWCTICAEQQAALSELARSDPDRLVFVGVVDGDDDPADVQDYLRRYGVEHPVLVDDGTIWRAYAVREPPAVVLIARGGVLLRGFPGGVDVTALADLLAAL